jgi:FtsP/CotA-like multicopper oxidase with cupredoxin domain
VLPSGQLLREYWFTAEDREIEIAPGITFPAWSYNGQVPGPTIRATEGDRIRVHFTNNGTRPHTIHFHGYHPEEMDGFDTNFDEDNEVYAVNTVAFHYKENPIPVRLGETVRIYLVNILEFDETNSFHLHANFFDEYRTGTSLTPTRSPTP